MTTFHPYMEKLTALTDVELLAEAERQQSRMIQALRETRLARAEGSLVIAEISKRNAMAGMACGLQATLAMHKGN